MLVDGRRTARTTPLLGGCPAPATLESADISRRVPPPLS